jgi:hypothetical protein
MTINDLDLNAKLPIVRKHVEAHVFDTIQDYKTHNANYEANL